MKNSAVVIAALLLLPCLGEAGTECHYVEYPERFVAVCVGDEPYTPPETRAVAAAPAPVRAEDPRRSSSRVGGASAIVLKREMPEPADAAEPERNGGAARGAVVTAQQEASAPQSRTLREPRPGRMTAQRVEAAITQRIRHTRGE